MTDTARTDTGAEESAPTTRIRVWDPLIRVFHWGLVAAFAIAYLSAEELDTVHEVAGYVVAGLIAFRLIWGLVGSHYARFTEFLRGPSATLGYTLDMVRGRERRYLGHNPVGAVMIVVLLAALSGTAYTGWLLEEPGRVAMLPDMPQIAAPAFADEDGEAGEYGRESGGDEIVEELHETLANITLFLIALHIVGVVLSSFRHHENLARAMVTGDKRAPGPDDIT